MLLFLIGGKSIIPVVGIYLTECGKRIGIGIRIGDIFLPILPDPDIILTGERKATMGAYAYEIE